MRNPEQFDFPCSQSFREYFSSPLAEHDYPVSTTWANHYVGQAPAPPEVEPPRPPMTVKIFVPQHAAQPKAKPEMSKVRWGDE